MGTQQSSTYRILQTMNKEIENLLAEAALLEKEGDLQAALIKYGEIVETDQKNIEVQFKIGELYHQLGDLPKALSAYLRTTDLDAEHQKAKVKIEMIRSIMNFYNKDMYNP